MFHVEHFKSQLNDFQSLIEKSRFYIYWLILAIIITQFIALAVTFSKSAIIGLFIALIYLKLRNVPRGTFLVNSLRRFSFRIKLLSGSIIVFIAFFIIRYINLYYFIIQPLKERLFFLNILRQSANVPHGTFLVDLMLGHGIGQFIPFIHLSASKILLSWQYQPIHNVFLLIYAELGVIGAGIFIWFLWILFHPIKPSIVLPYEESESSESVPLYKNVPCGTFLDQKVGITNAEQTGECSIILQNNNNLLSSNICLVYFKAILIGFIFIMLFDHYFWDIQQGSLMLWIVLGLVTGLYKDN
jgi:hypothetical protein